MSQIMGKQLQKCRNLCFLMRLRHISYGIALRRYDVTAKKLLLSFDGIGLLYNYCENFRNEKFR